MQKKQSHIDIERTAQDRVFNQDDFLPGKQPRKFTREERRRMLQYESVDSYEPQTTVYKDHLEYRAREPRSFIWVFVFIVGVLTGLLAVLFVSTLHVVFAVKERLLSLGLEGFATGTGHNNEALSDVFGGADAPLVGVAPPRNLGAGYVMWAVSSVLCALIASFIAYFVPESVGAGMPETSAYLNGVDSVSFANKKVFVAKVVSGIFSVASGACVGYYGTLIQCGTMIASFVLARSRLVRCDSVQIISCFRNPRDRRIITVLGAAAGVASAFSVTLGGLVFIMEQLSTIFPVRFALYVFVACLISAFTVQSYFSYFAYFQARDRSGMNSGELLFDALVQFDTRYGPTIRMNILDFIPTILIGVACGFLSVAFIRLVMISVRFWRKAKRYPLVRFCLPLLTTFVYVTCVFWIAVAFGHTYAAASVSTNACTDVPDAFVATRGSSVVSYYGLTASLCDPLPAAANATAKSPLMHTFASLGFGFADSTLQMILSWQTSDSFSPSLIAVFLPLYFVFAAIFAGTSTSGDVLLPLMVLGGCVGRLVGIGTRALAITFLPQARTWADPGVFAMVGAGSFLAGATGMTFSICIILMEMTNDFRHVLCVMVGISISKTIAGRYIHSVTNSYLEAMCVPLLDFAEQIHKYDMFCARHVMASNVQTLETVAPIGDILDALNGSTHNGFPVASLRDRTYKGIILRSELRLVLWHCYFTHSVAPCSYANLKRVEDRLFYERLEGQLPKFSDAWLDERLDLSPYIDHSGFTIQEATSLSRTYFLFRTLGLRHLVVVNRDNLIVGIITRKDLVSDNIMERIRRENDRRQSQRAAAAAAGGNSFAEDGNGSLAEPLTGPKPPRSRTDEDWIVLDDEEEIPRPSNTMGFMHPSRESEIAAAVVSSRSVINSGGLGAAAPPLSSGSSKARRRSTKNSVASRSAVMAAGATVTTSTSSKGSVEKNPRVAAILEKTRLPSSDSLDGDRERAEREQPAEGAAAAAAVPTAVPEAAPALPLPSDSSSDTDVEEYVRQHPELRQPRHASRPPAAEEGSSAQEMQDRPPE